MNNKPTHHMMTPEEIADDFLDHLSIKDPMERSWFRYNMIENLKQYSDYQVTLARKEGEETIREKEKEIFALRQEVLRLDDQAAKPTLKRHFESEKIFLDFMCSLDQMLSRISFNGERKVKEAKHTTASMVIRFDNFKTLEKESYYLGLSKIGKVVMDSISEKKEGEEKLKEIRDEISNNFKWLSHSPEADGYNSAIREVIDLIDKHLNTGEQKGENNE